MMCRKYPEVQIYPAIAVWSPALLVPRPVAPDIGGTACVGNPPGDIAGGDAVCGVVTAVDLGTRHGRGVAGRVNVGPVVENSHRPGPGRRLPKSVRIHTMPDRESLNT